MGSNERPELMDAVINYASDGIITMDAAGSIVSFNPAAEQIFGYAANEIIGRDIAMLMPEAYREPFCRLMRDFDAVGTGLQPGRSIGLHGITRDGDEFPVEWSVNAMQVEGQRLFVAMLRDATDQHRMEKKLRHIQKMEAVGDLVGGVAHNFNNMLAAIVGNVGLAKMEAGDSPRLISYLESVETISLRAGEMVEQLLIFASRDYFQHKHNISLAPLVVEGVDIARLDIGEDVELSVEIADESLASLCDANQIRQVVINMVDNAWHAVADNEEKRIRVSLDRCEPDVDFFNRHFELEEGAYARLQISDNGCGMDARTMVKMFEPFFTTREVGKGIGLGLSTAFGTISSHGGVIDVESSVGEGSVFNVYLPLVELASAEDMAAGEG